MKTIQKIMIPLALVIALSTLFVAQSAHAIDIWGACSGGGGGNATGSANAGAGTSAVCNSTGDSAPDLIKNVINAILVVLGMIAVIMIIIGGIRYTTSNGDSSATKSAKDTILYAVIGLVVAIMAFAIVNFVVTAFTGSGGGTNNGGGNTNSAPAPATNNQPGGSSTTITPGAATR